MSSDFVSDHPARMAGLHAAQALAELVGVTYGSVGAHVMLDRTGDRVSEVTREGASVAQGLELKDAAENAVAQLIRAAGEETRLKVGDGSTTTMLLASALIEVGIRWTSAGEDASALARSLRRASMFASQNLDRSLRPVRDDAELGRIASLAAGDAEALGALLATALSAAGWEGDVQVEVGVGLETGVTVLDGFRLPVTVLTSEQAVWDAIKMRDSRVLLYDGSLRIDGTLGDLMQALRRDERALVVLSTGFSESAVTRINRAAQQGTPSLLLARLDADFETRTDMMDDLALYTGGAIRVEAAGQSWPREAESLGRARVGHVDRAELRLVDGAGVQERIAVRVAGLRERLQGLPADARTGLHRRIGRLTGRTVVVHLSASTEPAIRELEARAERALAVGRAALEGGVVSGGALALLRAAQSVEPERMSDVAPATLVEAAEALVSRLATNAGAAGPAIVEEVRGAPGRVGFDARAKRVHDLDAAGVLDAAKVVRTALETATSVACKVLATGGVLTDSRRQSSSRARRA